MSEISVIIAGLTGRMGKMVSHAVTNHPEIRLVAGVSHGNRPTDLADTIYYADDLAKIGNDADVVIDFTHASLVQHHANILAEKRIAWVLGTTGISEDDQALIKKVSDVIPIVQASNFSLGVALLTHLVSIAAQSLPTSDYDVEILDVHHRQKIDAPSGTALTLGKVIAASRHQDPKLAQQEICRNGHTGPRVDGTIGYAALRSGQIVGEHTVFLTSADEQITLSHRAFDRMIFADGAVRAAVWIKGKCKGLYDMQSVLGLPYNKLG